MLEQMMCKYYYGLKLHCFVLLVVIGVSHLPLQRPIKKHAFDTAMQNRLISTNKCSICKQNQESEKLFSVVQGSSQQHCLTVRDEKVFPPLYCFIVKFLSPLHSTHL